MNYIDGRFVPIAGSTKRNVPLNNQLEAPHSKEVGLDQDGQHDFTADATKGCAQEKPLEELVAKEVEKRIAVLERTQEERLASLEFMVTRLEARLEKIDDATGNPESVSKYELEDIRVELSSLQRELRLKNLNVQESADKETSDSKANNLVYGELVENNRHGAPNLSNLYAKTEQLGKLVKSQVGVNVSNQGIGAPNVNRVDNEARVSPYPKPATPPFTNVRKALDNNDEGNQSDAMQTREAYLRASLNDRIYNHAFNAGRVGSASGSRPKSASDRYRSKEGVNDAKIVSIANVKFNEPIEPTEFREVTPAKKSSNNARSVSPEVSKGHHGQQRDGNIRNQDGSNENGGGHSNGWLLQNDRDQDVDMNGCNDSSSARQYHHIINNALRPSSSNSVRFKKQIKSKDKRNNKQRYLVFPPKTAAAKSEDRVVNKQKYESGAQESLQSVVGVFKAVEGGHRGGNDRNFKLQPNYQDVGAECPPSYPKPSSKAITTTSTGQRSIRFAS